MAVAPLKQRVMNEKMARSLELFVSQAWHIVEPGRTFVPNWHITEICRHLEAVSRGDIKRLIINIPPRHMKSLLVAVFWPAWEWITRPETRWLFASYAHTLSIRDSVKCRRLVEHPWFRERWGDVFSLTSDQNQKIKYDNDQMGHRLATSVGGALTGEGGDIIVVDDPHNVVEGESEALRESVLEWWDQAMSTRLNDPKTGRYVIVMQRVHERDLVGHILKKEKGWDHLCIPAEFEPDHPTPIRSSLGTKDSRTVAGELLWPERVGRTEILELQGRLGSYGAAGQLQQRPSPAGGGMFKRSWFRYYQDLGDYLELDTPTGPKRVMKVDLRRFIMSDLALTEKTQADYTVIQTWGQTKEDDILLLDQYREQVEAPTAEAMLWSIRFRNKAEFVGVENKHYGAAVFQKARNDNKPVVELVADKDKVTRAILASIMFENGRVYLPAGAPWLPAYEAELETFPNGAHDDQVDPTAYCARYVDENRRKGGEALAISATDDWDR